MNYQPSTDKQRAAEQDAQNLSRFCTWNNKRKRIGLKPSSLSAYFERKLSMQTTWTPPFQIKGWS